MAAHTVTLRLPAPVYERYKQRAVQTHRSVETELLDAVTTAAPETEELPQDVCEALASLETLADDELWSAARNAFPLEDGARLEALHLKRQDKGLTAAEQATAAELVQQYERAMLMRAHALQLLKERGHDISGLVAGR